MQRLEVSGAVRLIYKSLGVKGRRSLGEAAREQYMCLNQMCTVSCTREKKDCIIFKRKHLASRPRGSLEAWRGNSTRGHTYWWGLDNAGCGSCRSGLLYWRRWTVGCAALVNTVTSAEFEQTLTVRCQAWTRVQVSTLVNCQPRLAVGLEMGEGRRETVAW